MISLVGDGCFVFGVPSSAYWVSGAYRAPHLTVIYDNGGWNSPRVSTALVHPNGPAERQDAYWIAAGRGAALEQIAQATGGAVGYAVEERATLKDTLRSALRTVRDGTSAVVAVKLAPVTAQVLGRSAV